MSRGLPPGDFSGSASHNAMGSLPQQCWPSLQSSCRSHITQTIKDDFIHFTKLLQCSSIHLVSHSSFTYPAPPSFNPSRFLWVLMSYVDCSSRRRLVGEYLNTIARVCGTILMKLAAQPLMTPAMLPAPS